MCLGQPYTTQLTGATIHPCHREAPPWDHAAQLAFTHTALEEGHIAQVEEFAWTAAIAEPARCARAQTLLAQELAPGLGVLGVKQTPLPRHSVPHTPMPSTMPSTHFVLLRPIFVFT